MNKIAIFDKMQLFFYLVVFSSLMILYWVAVNTTISEKPVQKQEVYQTTRAPTVSERNFSYKEKFSLRSGRAMKKILLWNSPHRIEASAFGIGHTPFLQCPISECDVIPNNSVSWPQTLRGEYRWLAFFDAVLISVHDLRVTTFLPPSYQPPEHQRIVFFTQESPVTSELNGLKVKEFRRGIFNWTMTYKSSADVQLNYGKVIRNNSAPKKTKKYRLPRNRMGKVVWMSSHCNTASLRESYVAELAKYIPVDVYGKCGGSKLRCPRLPPPKHWLSAPKCYLNMSRNYKFYLSFENSICLDYVTEKFFNILNYDMIPVVMGGAHYESIAPPHSYINALKFAGPKELADYLHKLDEDDNLYAEFFKWKGKYSIESDIHAMSRNVFCDLCAKLHADEPQKYYPSMVPVWNSKFQCFGTWEQALKRKMFARNKD